MKLKIKVKSFFNDPSLVPVIVEPKGDCFDLIAAESKTFHAPKANTLHRRPKDGEDYRHVDIEEDLIELGVAMQLPKGFKAVVYPRSSTFKKFGVLQANSVGIIDNCYNGNNDQWKFPAIALRSTTIHKGDKLCQFEIQPTMKATVWQKLKWLFSNGVTIEYVNKLNDIDRGGFGSTGTK